jgi:hypothetical protein
MALLEFTSNNTIPLTSASAPTRGGIKCLSVVSMRIPRKLTGFPGVVKVMPEYASNHSQENNQDHNEGEQQEDEQDGDVE